MQAHMNNLRSSVILGVAALLATVSGLSCYERPDSFQPITYGAKPWNPPAGWDPEPACATGYYVAINTCEGCKDISYALCTGTIFTQCVCGGPFWPGATCPQQFVCAADDFPPFNWVEFTDYAGPGWAGLSQLGDAGSP